MPEPIDELTAEIDALRRQVLAVNQDLDDMRKLFMALAVATQGFSHRLESVKRIVSADFKAYTGVEASLAKVLVPSGLATNTKKAVKRWPDPIKKNADKATSAGHRPAKAAAH
jgi:hypothetical protein